MYIYIYIYYASNLQWGKEREGARLLLLLSSRLALTSAGDCQQLPGVQVGRAPVAQSPPEERGVLGTQSERRIGNTLAIMAALFIG